LSKREGLEKKESRPFLKKHPRIRQNIDFTEEVVIIEATGLPTISKDSGYSEVTGSGRINVITE
jgi:hypothetical protein